jgi:CO/xanthine dehydrogenase FAD-binding subunit
MKAAEFDYVRARDLADTCRLLASAPEDSRILAGGQTLVPLMAMRLARPSLVIDINRVAELDGIAEAGDAIVVRGATRQESARRSDLVHREVPLLAKALGFVGHPQTRRRGTIGGSLAHADPAAEIPLVVLVLDAEIVVQSEAGTRAIAAGDFFVGPMTTALDVTECLTEIRFPRQAAGTRQGTGFQEVSLRRSDFALASAAVRLTLDPDGACSAIRAAVGGVGGTPVRIEDAEAALLGTRLGADDLARAGALVASALDPPADLHASSAYRRRAAVALFERAVREARDEAMGAAA